MRITGLELSRQEDRVRTSATVHWEDCGEPAREVFIETEEQFGEDLSRSPHSFLVGCLLPALHYGEKRIAIEGEICPLLREGLYTAMGLIHHWSPDAYHPLAIEGKVTTGKEFAPRPLRAGFFLSGGMDSLAALRLNRMHFPLEHPAAISDGFVIHGFDIGGVVKRGMKYHVFERTLAALAPIAQEAQITLIPVYTNIRHLCDERVLWLDKFFGAVLVAVGHAFDRRLNLVYVPSSYDIPNLGPCGSHPLLDPCYSSYTLRVIHRDVELSRLEKLKVVAGWEVAFQNFRVCTANVPDRLNCGECEKCVRTMAGLEAIGALAHTRAFVENKIRPEQLSQFSIRIRHREPFYEELLAPLRARGRKDLVQTIERMLAAEPPGS